MSELEKAFQRRQDVGASGDDRKIFNPYSEFPELSRKEIREYEKTFKKYDTSRDGFLDLMELKYLMEKLGSPQTHIGLKAMIKEVDEDNDGVMSFREFLLIFVKATRGDLHCAGLQSLSKSVDVAAEGVHGAKGFFEAHINQQSASLKNEQEIKAEQVEKRKEREAAAKRRADFKAKSSIFK
uniref:EF-hand domain family n=1 Tax=Hirondellea gigas TaxID=1518452 RepID=A0A6A7G0A1_9CRUS